MACILPGQKKIYAEDDTEYAIPIRRNDYLDGEIGKRKNRYKKLAESKSDGESDAVGGLEKSMFPSEIDEMQNEEGMDALAMQTAASTAKNLWTEDKTSVLQALSVVADMCGKEDAEVNRNYFGRIGGPVAIVQTMKTHADDMNIQTEGCRALMNLAFHNADNREVIGGVGGLYGVIKAMKNFPEHIALQKCGCGALQNLMFESKHNKKRVLIADGVSLIITAMKVHGKSKALQYHACRCIANLATTSREKVKKIVFESKGLSVIAMCAEDGDNEGLRKAAAACLNRLAPF